jgi:hypothetical protein
MQIPSIWVFLQQCQQLSSSIRTNLNFTQNPSKILAQTIRQTGMWAKMLQGLGKMQSRAMPTIAEQQRV